MRATHRSLSRIAETGATRVDPGLHTSLQLVFERVWLDEGRVVVVRPKQAFALVFQRRQRNRRRSDVKERERRDSNPTSGVTDRYGLYGHNRLRPGISG